MWNRPPHVVPAEERFHGVLGLGFDGRVGNARPHKDAEGQVPDRSLQIECRLPSGPSEAVEVLTL